jgi:acyl-coenzyme A thioesterase PaaI-like protein
MPESLKTRFLRWRFNFFPAYRGTGARLTYIADDFHEIRTKLPLNWRTKNYVGTTFGGSLYGAVDPLYMVMLIKILGNGYVVWDKAATIRFKRPGRETLFATFVVTPEEVEQIKQDLKESKSIDRIFHVDLVDRNGKVHAQIEKTLYFASKVRADASGESKQIAATH